MNTLAAPDNRLVNIIEFKWLMAGAGIRVHVERMQADPGYAAQCLREGVQSRIPALRDAAAHLAVALAITL